MDLPNIFGAKKSPATQRFLALDIGEEAITAGLWSVEGGKAKLIKSSSAIEWKDEGAEGAAEAADVALDELGKETQSLEQVVLGLQDSWVGEKGILESRRSILKAVRDQLELKPLGFVVTTEALSQYLRILEGGPITAVTIEYTATNLHVSLIHAGKIEKRETVGRSGDTIADLTEAFTRLKSKSLPARILLLSRRMRHEELEAEKQLVTANDWKETTFFLHVPKVEALPQNVFITALCVAGGTEIAVGMGLIPASESQPSTDSMAVGQMGEVGKEGLERKKAEVHELPTEELNIPAEVPPVMNAATSEPDFGFTEVEHGKLKEQVAPAEEPQGDLPEEPETAEPETAEPSPRTIKMDDVPVGSTLPKKPRKNIFLPLIDLKNKIVNTVFGGRSLAAKFGAEVSGKKRLRMVLVVLAIVLVVSGVAGYVGLAVTHVAVVTATMKTLPLSKEITLTVSPDVSATDAEEGILKVRIVEKEASGEKERDTTGSSIVGDNATGKVTIYNATGSEKSFPAGTILTGSGGLQFTLDDDVVVASSSGSASSIQSGTVEADVTASGIGPEYNLGANTEFSVANFDKISYVAKNSNAFSGGSKREIQAASEEDIEAATADLRAELEEQARQLLETDTTGAERVLPANRVEVTASAVDAEEGDEVQTIKVSMTVVASAYEYDIKDLIPLVTKEFADELEAGALLREEKTALEVLEVLPADDEEDALPTMSVVLKTEVIPSLDRAAATTAIRGAPIEQVTQLLKDRGEVDSVEVQMKPGLAGLFFDKLPGNESKITLQVKVP